MTIINAYIKNNKTSELVNKVVIDTNATYKPEIGFSVVIPENEVNEAELDLIFNEYVESK